MPPKKKIPTVQQSDDLKAVQAETLKAARIAIEKISKTLARVDTSTIEISDSKGLYNLANSIAAMGRSLSDIERSQRDRASLMIDVRNEFVWNFRQLLQNEKPELYTEIREVIERARVSSEMDDVKLIK